MTDQSIHVVTSCSLKGWEQYGSRFVQTFLEHWPLEVSLHVVSEEADLIPLTLSTPHSVKLWPLQHDEMAKLFLETNKENSWKHGLSSFPRPQNIAPRWREISGYNFRYDAYKFSKKVFAIQLVAEYLQKGRLLWIDADALTFAPVPVTLAQSVLPESYAISCLARPGYHSECGFVGYNLDHPQALHFIRSFAALYGSEAVFELPEWHDSYVLDWMRNKLQTKTYSIPHRSKGHPFINSELGKYMDHLKGKRKNMGKSNTVEQVVHRKLDYWRGRTVKSLT